MKIAIATDAGRTVSEHFGRAAHHAVLTIEGNLIVERELRPKVAPHLAGTAPEAHAGSGPRAPTRHPGRGTTRWRT